MTDRQYLFCINDIYAASIAAADADYDYNVVCKPGQKFVKVEIMGNFC